MAEVKPIPSAVGAYEAQIFDMSKAYQTLARTYAQARKETQEMRKRYETELNTVLNDERLIRPQDDKYINFLKQDTRNFYYQNKDAIERGESNAINQFNEKKGRTKATITESASLKSNETALTTYITSSLGKDWEIANPEFYSNVNAFKSPLGDAKGNRNTERENYRIYDANTKTEKSINELSPLDLNRQRYYTMVDVDADLKSNVTPVVVSYESDKGVTEDFAVVAPNDLASALYSSVNSKISVLPQIEKNWDNVKNDPQRLKQIGNNLITINKSYTTAKTKYGGKSLGSIDALFQSGIYGTDNTPGVSNAFEYALYEKLLAYLPQQVARKKSYEYENYMLSVMNYKKSKEWTDFQMAQIRKNAGKDATFQEALISDIRSGNLTKMKGFYQQTFNTYYGYTPAGQEKPADYKLSDDGKTLTVVTNRMLYQPGGNLVGNINDAITATNRKYGLLNQQQLNNNNTPGIYAKKFTGPDNSTYMVYYQRDVKTYDISKDNPNLGVNINSALQDGVTAQPNDEARRFLSDFNRGKAFTPAGTQFKQ